MSNKIVPDDNLYENGKESVSDDQPKPAEDYRSDWVKLTKKKGEITKEGGLAALIVGALIQAGLFNLSDDLDGSDIHQAMRLVAALLKDNLAEDYPSFPLRY